MKKKQPAGIKKSKSVQKQPAARTAMKKPMKRAASTAPAVDRVENPKKRAKKEVVDNSTTEEKTSGSLMQMSQKGGKKQRLVRVGGIRKNSESSGSPSTSSGSVVISPGSSRKVPTKKTTGRPAASSPSLTTSSTKLSRSDDEKGPICEILSVKDGLAKVAKALKDGEERVNKTLGKTGRLEKLAKISRLQSQLDAVELFGRDSDTESDSESDWYEDFSDDSKERRQASVLKARRKTRLYKPFKKEWKPKRISQPLKPPQTKIIVVNFGDRRILSLCLKTELNSVFGGGVGTCLGVETLAGQVRLPLQELSRAHLDETGFETGPPRLRSDVFGGGKSGEAGDFCRFR